MITLCCIDVFPLLNVDLFLPLLVAFQRARLDEPIPRTTGSKDGEQDCILAPDALVSNTQMKHMRCQRTVGHWSRVVRMDWAW